MGGTDLDFRNAVNEHPDGLAEEFDISQANNPFIHATNQALTKEIERFQGCHIRFGRFTRHVGQRIVAKRNRIVIGVL